MKIVIAGAGEVGCHLAKMLSEGYHEITIIGYKDTYKELVELCQGVCFSFKKANQ